MKFRHAVAIRILLGMAFLLCALQPAASLLAQDEPATDPAASDGGWPREYVVDQTTYTVYQPQVESWDQALLTASAAVAIQTVGGAGPEYGTIKFTARTLVDKEAELVTLTDIQIAEGAFPSASDQGAAYVTALKNQFVASTTQIALGRLEASLAIAQASQKNRGQEVSNEPPRIIYSDKPAVLILVDGPPAMRSFGVTGLTRVINTRALIVLDQGTGKHYLRVLGGWMKANTIEGPWTYEPSPPASLDRAVAQAAQQPGIDLMDPTPDNTYTSAQIAAHVSTTPAELEQTDGPPNYLPIPGTQILYASNTESQLFLYLPEQKVYFLVSGRWFRSASLDKGPWEYVDQAKLAPDFARIPEEHPSGGALASVAGTPQAAEAVISNGIPQTAEVQREGPSLTVAYDGNPTFEKVEGTPLSCAVNTMTPVIQVSPTSYYACDNAVWFSAASSAGPWTVAVEVPAAIYTIPVRHRLHFVTYVRVYRYTPETVIFGYTPGYYGTVIAPSGCVVYGTGFRFKSYCGAFWAPMPVTYGWGADFACGYRTGFAFGFTAGWLVGAWCHPCWGGFGWDNVRFNRFSHISFNHFNSFHHWDTHVVHRDRVIVQSRRLHVPGRVHYVPNNVVAGHDGRVYRWDGAGAVERRDSGQWKSVGQQRAEREHVQAVHRELQVRGHGEERSRAIGPTRIPGGGFHGGTGGGFQRSGGLQRTGPGSGQDRKH